MMKKQIHKDKISSVCLVTVRSDKHAGGGNILVSNILDILQGLKQEIFLIADHHTKKQIEMSEKIHILNLKYLKGDSVFSKLLSYLIQQLQISFIVIKIRNKITKGFFFVGGSLLLPTVTARILGKDAILVNPASGYKRIKMTYEDTFLTKYLFSHSIRILEILTQMFSSEIVLSTPYLSSYLGLSRYQDKIHYAAGEFIKPDKFKMEKRFDERGNLVGYIGRLSEEKGILEFVKAIPKILKERDDIEFLIGGDGPLRKEIEKYFAENNLDDKIRLIGWIPHDELSDYLNELKVVVLPSYTEGLPNIMLEAMACGTPVLAKSVGSVPDVITDCETGFIMENNLPECIAENVTRVFNYQNLDKIAENARVLVEKEFTYEAAVERYKKILVM